MTRRWHIVAAWIASFVTAVAAHAQVMPLVPDPITTPELMTYSELIGLSDQQRLGLLPAHDAYKERYKQFQDRDVKKLRDAVVDIALRFRPNRFSIPPRDELEAIVDQYKRVLNGAHAMDRSLFDEMSATLTEEQSLKLQRARTARELAAYHQLVTEFAGEFNPGAGINFTQLLRNLKLPPDEFDKADPILAEYESASLARTRDVYAAMTKSVTIILDLIDQYGLRDMTVEKLMAWVQDDKTILTFQTTFDEASKPFQAAVFDLSQLNFRTYKRLVAVLNPESVKKLRDRYYDIAFDDAYSGPGQWQQRYHAALELTALSADQKQNIQVQRDTFEQQQNALVDGIVPHIEGSREYRTFDQLRNENQTPLHAKLQDLEKRVDSIDESAVAALNGILGPELCAELDQNNSKQRHGTGGLIVASASGGPAPVIDAAPTTAPAKPEVRDDPFLPQSMSVADIKQIAEALELSRENQTVLSTLYDEYRAQYDTMRGSPLEFEHATDVPTPTDEAKARQNRTQSLAQLDDKFFDDAELLADTARQHTMVRWNRQARQRQAINGAASAMSGRWYGNQEAYVDPLLMLCRTQMDDSSCQAVQSIVEEYGRRVEPLITARLDAARESQRRLEAQRRVARGEGGEQAAQLARDKWMQSMRELRKLNTDIRAINRRAIADLTGQLPSGVAWTIKNAYNRAAFPEVFGDPESAETTIQAVLGLNELGQTERDAVNLINDGYRSEYFAICDRMVEIRQQRRDFEMGRDEIFKRDDVEREVELERLNYERREVNARAKLRVRLVLPAEISRHVPGLMPADAE